MPEALPTDTYLTLDQPGEGYLTEKRSRFPAFAMHVDSEEEAKALVAQYKKKYYDARHVCYAYVIGDHGERTRSNDDGEPSGSAGVPILGRLRAAGLTYALVIVVRYFGGVKLGTGGLAVAYKTAAAEAIAAATVKECIVKARFQVEVPYADADVMQRFVKEADADIVERNYTDKGVIAAISIRLTGEAALRTRLAQILSLKFRKQADE